MKPKGQLYWCKKCDTFEYIPDSDGIKAAEIVAVYCPRCICKNKQHHYKMHKVKEDETKTKLKGGKKQYGRNKSK